MNDFTGITVVRKANVFFGLRVRALADYCCSFLP